MKKIICYFFGHLYEFARELNGGLPTGGGAMWVETLLACKRCGDLKVDRQKWD